MTTEVSTDVDTLAAEPSSLTLVSGMEIRVERLRTRALMSLLKILTRGAAEVLPSLSFDADTSGEEFAAQVLGAMLLAIPEAEDEVVEFINRMVVPARLVPGTRLSKEDQATNDELWAELQSQLADPDPQDTLTILGEVVKVESPHILALGKQLGVLIQAQRKSETAKQGASSKRSSRK